MSSFDERLERIEAELDRLLAAAGVPEHPEAAPRARARKAREPTPSDDQPAAPMPDVIICADWSKHLGNRRAWFADPVRRRIGPLGAERPTVELLVDAAERYRAGGYALVAFDAPIGVSASYLAAARSMVGLPDDATFVDWLPTALRQADFLEPVVRAEDWSPARPFFRVPAGKGGLTSMQDAARRCEVLLSRAIDIATRATSVFAFDLPGQVGPAAQSLWRELVYAIENPKVAIWPFDGSLVEAAQSAEMVAAEIYPRAAYGTALAAALPAAPRALAKTKQPVREEAVRKVLSSPWLVDAGVVIEEAARADENEDDFDALMTAAALLRLTLEERPLSTFAVDPIAEGAILGV